MSAKRRKKQKNRKPTQIRRSPAKTQPSKAKSLEEAIDRMDPFDRLILWSRLELLLDDLHKQIANLPTPVRRTYRQH